MKHIRRAAINGGALGFLIVLVVLTILFSVLTYIKAERSRVIYEGDPEDVVFSNTSLTSVLTEVANKRAEIEREEEAFKTKLRQMDEIDLELGKLGTYHHDTEGWVISYSEDGVLGPAGLQVKEMEHKVQRLKRRKDIQEAMATKGFPQLRDTANKFSDLAELELDKSTKIEDELQRKKDELQKKIELLTRQRLQVEADHRKSKAAKMIKISQLEAQIRELLELRLQWLKDIEPDGKVLYSDLNHKYVMVDRGSVYGVFTGLKFEVFQYVKGQILLKGMIEVVSVNTESARCRVLYETDPRDNGIIRGDLIGNPVFCPPDPKTFFLAGEFDAYNKGDLEEFIRLMGGIVKTELVPGIDFMIAGKGSEKMQDAAREYQVIAMTEDQLIKYVTPRFMPLSADELEARAREAAELEALKKLQEEAKKKATE